MPTTLPGFDFIQRAGVDLLLPLRHAALGPLFPADQSDVAVVVIDEETYRTPPFADRPQVAWTPYLAKVIEAVDEAGPAALGLDLIYPVTLDQADLLPGFDRPLLKAFLKSGRAGRLVLGQARLSQQEIAPQRRQLVAAGGAPNLRTLNLLVDPDEVVRRYPARFGDEAGGAAPSFGMELARRFGAAAPEADFLINFNTGADDVPTFSLADLYACAEAGRADFFARFRGKVVLVGTALDLEDRRQTAKRFAQGRPDRSAHPRCAAPFDAARFGEIVDRTSLPGVYVHAAAINTVTKGLTLAPMPRAWSFTSVGASGAALSGLLFLMPPFVGALAALAALGLLAAVSLALFAGGIVPPLLAYGFAAALAFTAVYAYRFVVEDKTKRWIQHAFQHFLAPPLVERLAGDPSLLQLGGTRRRVTVMFSDIAGFTTLSEKLGDRPELLVEIMNRYLTLAAGAVEANGGYVDKFIGDAVMAIWGAPLDDPEAERRAVAAALHAIEALEAFNRDVVVGEYGLPPLGTRIGVNTGVAIVGNMGSRTRLNYTVTGDMVNLAARLEGANKTYGTRIMLGEETARAARGRFLLRRLDLLVVKGKRLPVKVYEAVCPRAEETPEARARVRAFHAALALYYRRRFAEAEAAFAALAPSDPPAALYVARCAAFRAAPPGPGWNRSFALDSK